MAQMKKPHASPDIKIPEPEPEDEITTEGCLLAAIQALQLLIGLLGQFWLLSRWAQQPGTDSFVLLSGIPWIAASALLVSGLDDCLPAILNQSATAQGTAAQGTAVRQSRLIAQITGFTIFLSLLAALASGAVIGLWATRLGIPTRHALLMGAALGAQVLPFGLSTLWHGYLTTRDRVVWARLPLLTGSIATALGTLVARGAPTVVLPAITFSATLATMLATWAFTKAEARELPGPRAIFAATLEPWEPEILHLLANLVAAGIAAALIHVEALLLRSSVGALGVGSVTALSLAQRGWDAVMSLVIAAGIMPFYPEWSMGFAMTPFSTMSSVLRRSWGFTLAGAALVAGGLYLFGPALSRANPALVQAIALTWALLPRFILLSGIQPLVLRHFAAGEPWHPVLSSAAGLAVLALALGLAAPRWGIEGLALAAALATVPGWLYLGWRIRRQERLCRF
jgi:hypothetical protein